MTHTSSSEAGSHWFVCWPSNRILRDQLEPLLLINSSAALLTLTQKQLHLQLVDRFYTSVFQRTFWAGVDYLLTHHDPLQDDKPLMPLPTTFPLPPPPAPGQAPASQNQNAYPNDTGGSSTPLFEGTVDIGTVHDILSGTSPSTMALLNTSSSSQRSTNTTSVGTTTTNMNNNPRGKPNNPAHVDAAEDKDDDDEEVGDDDVDDDDDDEHESGKLTHGSSATIPRGRRALAASCNREEKAVWRFFCPTNRLIVPGSMDVKVRFVVFQHVPAAAPNAPLPNVAASMGGLSSSSFDLPMNSACQSASSSSSSSASTSVKPQSLSSQQQHAAANELGMFVARTSGWEKVPLVSNAPSAMITNVLEFGPCTPPRYYRFDSNSPWLNPSVGARVSLRCTSDLQDDLVNIVTVSEVCELAVTDGDLKLVTQSKRAKKCHILRYEQPYEFDATPLAASVSTPSTNIAGVKNKSKKKAGTGGVATAQTPSPGFTQAHSPAGFTQAHSPAGFTQAHSPAGFTQPKSSAIVTTPLPRRPVHNTPRFYVEYIHKNSLVPTLRCSFLLRSFRIIHKLIGASSRIEWILHHSPQAQSGGAADGKAPPPFNPRPTSYEGRIKAANAGPLLCTFYQGTLATERLVGVLMSIRLPPPSSHSSNRRNPTS